MPLVKKQDKENQTSVGFNMPESLNADVKDYCEWAGIPGGYGLRRLRSQPRLP